MGWCPVPGWRGSGAEVGSEHVRGLENILPPTPLPTGLSQAPTTPVRPGRLLPHLINLQAARPAPLAGTPSRGSQIKLQMGKGREGSVSRACAAPWAQALTPPGLAPGILGVTLTKGCLCVSQRTFPVRLPS